MDEQQITSPACKRLFRPVPYLAFPLYQIVQLGTEQKPATPFCRTHICGSLYLKEYIPKQLHYCKKIDVPSYNIPTLTRYLQNLKPKDAFVTLARFYRIINKNN